MFLIEEPGLLDFIYESSEDNEFIILTLLDIFHLSEDQAYIKALELSRNGHSTIGTFTRDIAETYEKKLLKFSYDEQKIIIFKIRRNTASTQ